MAFVFSVVFCRTHDRVIQTEVVDKNTYFVSTSFDLHSFVRRNTVYMKKVISKSYRVKRNFKQILFDAKHLENKPKGSIDLLS